MDRMVRPLWCALQPNGYRGYLGPARWRETARVGQAVWRTVPYPEATCAPTVPRQRDKPSRYAFLWITLGTKASFALNNKYLLSNGDSLTHTALLQDDNAIASRNPMGLPK